MLKGSHSGFSLVELIIGLAILALLMALGMPQYATFIANSRLRATAESINNGLNLARAEAVKSNTRAELVLTSDEPIEGLVNTLTPSTSGPNWVVREWSSTTNSYNFVDGKYGAEGSGRAEGNAAEIASSSASGYSGIVCFNGFGALTACPGNVGVPPGVSFVVTSLAGTCAASGGALRCLNVNVTTGGQVRICDPMITAAKDTRAC